jgi:esterase
MAARLAHASIRTQGGTPARSAVLLHGILGSGQNWRSFAQRLVQAFPDWQVLLPDLRGHGDSEAGTPPHSLAACAQDLDALFHGLGLQPELLCGHSFGGKVALTYARDHGSALRSLWVLDAPPGPRERGSSDAAEQSAVDVIRALRQIELPLRSRKALVQRLGELGLSRPIALWMTTNLAPRDGGYGWRFELDVVEEMLAGFLREDLWPVLEEPPAGLRVDVLRAERSASWQGRDLARVQRLAQAGTLRFHVLPESGHWVHADNPDGLFERLAASFRATL